MKLPPRQDRFCREYIKDFNATRAYIAAGYAKKGARAGSSRLLTNVNISAKVKELNDAVNKKLDFDPEWIRNKMRELVDECEGDPFILGGAQLRAKVLSDMGKIEGMFVDKHQIDGRSNIIFNLKTSRGKK